MDTGISDAEPDPPPDLVEPQPDAAPEPDPAPDPTPGVLPESVNVLVLLDGRPSPDTLVIQGGRTGTSWRTDEAGRVTVDIDPGLEGDIVVLASHPEARIWWADVTADTPDPMVIELTRCDVSDNPDYKFQDPGDPGRRENTAKCGHCHLTFNDEWFESPHRTTASNPTVHDLYAGTGQFEDRASCEAAGGRWAIGKGPGSGGRQIERCYLGEGVLPLLNPACEEPPCDFQATAFGGCADCHAPGIDGQLGGRDLLEAEGFAYDYGVFCNTCHQVESIDMAAEPGVAGRLKIVRPSEPASISLGAGGLLPLTFGPSHDSPNPRMGGVQRDHFRDGTLCAGCHQQDQPVLVPGVDLDTERWPDGRLPVHSTFQEWKDGALGEATTCPSCHMPPAPMEGNGSNIQSFEDPLTGVTAGWFRPPGQVRHHTWEGPRQPEGQMLELSAAIFLKKRVLERGQVEVEATVKNVGAGHALPTGEPMRSMVLRVEVLCGDAPQPSVGGDAVPDFGGALLVKRAEEGWEQWPGAREGDIIRVVRRPGGHYDYEGFGAFGDGRFDAVAKGMAVEHVVGRSTVVSLEGETVELDAPLPEGDVAYLVRPSSGAEHAGAAGFAFARVMVDAEGGRMAPHFAAVDVVSDNRLMPQASFTTRHLFSVGCEAPEARARLIYRAYPLKLARERGWEMRDAVMTEVVR